ncbi:MAG: patatin family protein, partial [Lentisphaeria bacterium]|nr:patatin family protein [Lentisphaeria bacterium]
MSRGLILEGGAMRGLFTAGILDFLMEEKIEFDAIAGVSAGAAFGCNYKSRQPGRALRYNKRFCRDPRYCSWRSWWKTGDLFGADFCYHELPDKLDLFDGKTFEENKCLFYLVCTDIHTGEPHYRLCSKADAECYEWMRASASMPLVSNVVKVGNGEYLDGALADSIPLRFLENRGFDRNVVILTQPAGYVKKPSRAMPLMKLLLKKYPALVKA